MHRNPVSPTISLNTASAPAQPPFSSPRHWAMSRGNRNLTHAGNLRLKMQQLLTWNNAMSQIGFGCFHIEDRPLLVVEPKLHVCSSIMKGYILQLFICQLKSLGDETCATWWLQNFKLFFMFSYFPVFGCETNSQTYNDRSVFLW